MFGPCISFCLGIMRANTTDIYSIEVLHLVLWASDIKYANWNCIHVLATRAFVYFLLRRNVVDSCALALIYIIVRAENGDSIVHCLCPFSCYVLPWLNSFSPATVGWFCNTEQNKNQALFFACKVVHWLCSKKMQCNDIIKKDQNHATIVAVYSMQIKEQFVACCFG